MVISQVMISWMKQFRISQKFFEMIQISWLWSNVSAHFQCFYNQTTPPHPTSSTKIKASDKKKSTKHIKKASNLAFVANLGNQCSRNYSVVSKNRFRYFVHYNLHIRFTRRQHYGHHRLEVTPYSNSYPHLQAENRLSDLQNNLHRIIAFPFSHRIQIHDNRTNDSSLFLLTSPNRYLFSQYTSHLHNHT